MSARIIKHTITHKYTKFSEVNLFSTVCASAVWFSDYSTST